MSKLPEGKLYYSISEVAEMAGVEPYVLRFWEKEFPSIKPRKNRAGNRAYQKKEIEKILHIKKLLYSEGFTIDGARNALRKESKDLPQDPNVERTRQLIKEIKSELSSLLKLFP